jgi:hypothetical protein
MTSTVAVVVGFVVLTVISILVDRLLGIRALAIVLVVGLLVLGYINRGFVLSVIRKPPPQSVTNPKPEPPPEAKPQPAPEPAPSPKPIPNQGNAEVALELAGREALQLELANTTANTADKPKYWFAMFNTTNCFIWPTKPADGCQPLPLQTQTYADDYINAKDRLGPWDVLSQSPSEVAKQHVKSGDVIVGIIGVTCSNCERARRYLVYFKGGEGGWFFRITKPDFSFPILTAHVPEGDLQQFLDLQVPRRYRIAIPDHFDFARPTEGLP